MRATMMYGAGDRRRASRGDAVRGRAGAALNPGKQARAAVYLK
jgi:hypothetical protein